MVKAIIFDCFGVLIIGGRQTMLKDHPTVRDELHDLTVRSDYGFITREEYNDAVAALTGLSARDINEKYWSKNVRNEPMFEWVRNLKKAGEYKIGLLSNIGPGWLEDLFPKSERDAMFDSEVLSGEVGLTKPDPAIFELAAARLGVDTSECIMIDDLIENIDGASTAGMFGIVYDSVLSSEEELERLLQEHNA